jgi:hypothetical protein
MVFVLLHFLEYFTFMGKDEMDHSHPNGEMNVLVVVLLVGQAITGRRKETRIGVSEPISKYCRLRRY